MFQASANQVFLAPGLGLARARAHEATGPARTTFALFLAAQLTGPVLWIHTRWTSDRLSGTGIRKFLDPGRLIFALTPTLDGLLWTTEEAVRFGVVPLVVTELPAPPSLTQVRRLHLAAEIGAMRGTSSLVLLLTPGSGGAPGIETRWNATPIPGWALDGKARWRLTRLRARRDPEASWEARLEDDNRLHIERLPIGA